MEVCYGLALERQIRKRERWVGFGGECEEWKV